MKIRYYIPNQKAKKNNIMLSVHWEGIRLQVSTKKSIQTSHWDSKKETVKRNFSYAPELNRFLTNLKNEIENKYFSQISLGQSISKEQMRQIISQLLTPKEKSKNLKGNTLLDYFDRFVKERQQSNLYSKATVTKYNTVKKHVSEYQQYRRKTLTFDSINSEFSEDFISFLNVRQNLNNNSAGNVVKILKSFINWAFERDYHNNTSFLKVLKASKKDGQGVALTFEELEQLENVELNSKKLMKVRDLFLIQIYTGMRFSDLNNLKAENIDPENKIINIHMLKTEAPIIIPINSRLQAVLDRYPKYEIPKISNQKYNIYLKELCQKAGIDQHVQIVHYYGRVRKEETYPKYQLISSHTGRRTFITLSLKKNILPEMVMQVSGHKSRSSFQKYVKIAQDEAVEAVRNAWG